VLQKITIPVEHGRLEGLLQGPEAPRAAAVLCHPHPLHGGTMNNNVVYRTARALERGGLAVLRFNFRGVGASTGAHDHGAGEQDDVRAALTHLEVTLPGVPLWVAGFSFGARVGLATGAADSRVERLLGIGLVPRMFDFGFLRTSEKPKAFVCAANDELAELASVEAVIATAAPPKHTVVVPEAQHLFQGKLDELEAAVDEAIAFLAAHHTQRTPSNA
jgi:hypothetical protein